MESFQWDLWVKPVNDLQKVYWMVVFSLFMKFQHYFIARSDRHWCNRKLHYNNLWCHQHYSDVIMSTVASQISSLTIVNSLVYSGADQRKHQSSASLAFVRGIHRWPVNSPHKWPVTREMFPIDDVIMMTRELDSWQLMVCISLMFFCANCAVQNEIYYC